ncbi:restriction endonuclease subunit S [Streptococcaceae bacterium ESL0687]|nr:restriction endonuclease subunit S [Streptococcaceae bacterium ESL0687]
MADKKQVPRLRFRGFEGEWEEDKFDNLFDLSVPTNSLSRENLVYDEEKVKNIHYGDILTKFNSVLDASDKMIPYIRGASEDKFKKSFLNDGDIVIADAAEDESVGKSIEVRNVKKHPIVAGLHTIVARPKNIFAPLYLGHYLNSKIYHESLYRLMQGTKVLSLSKTNISKTSVCFPDYKEQEKIGTFFAQLDKLIALHEKKLADLKEIKKGYLQQMFPAPGQKIPQLRFQGFEGEWKNVIFNDILKFYSAKQYISGISSDGKFPVLKQGDNPLDGYANGEPFKDYSKVVVFGDHTLSIYKPNTPFFISTDGIKILSSNYMGSDYLFYSLERFKPHSEGYKRHLTILKNTLLSFTLDFEEQEKIGTFFANLDKNINQAEGKLNQLKALKKGFLQQMFI